MIVKLLLSLLFVMLYTFSFAQSDSLEHYEITGAKLGRKIDRQISQADYERTVSQWKNPYDRTGNHRPFSFVGAMDGAVVGSLAYSYKYQNYYHGPRKFNYRKKKENSTDISSLEIANITFADEDGNGIIKKDEVAQVYFDIINTGEKPLYGLIPVLMASDTKHIVISEPCPIDTLNSKSALRYVIEIAGDNKKDIKKNHLLLRINYGQQQYVDITEIEIGTKRKRTR